MHERVTNQHEDDIQDPSNYVQIIMEVIHLMAEYNPGLFMMQIGEQLDTFKYRVTVLVNAVQQLQHRQLAIDLLTPQKWVFCINLLSKGLKMKVIMLW
jgi:hypothetical protein